MLPLPYLRACLPFASMKKTLNLIQICHSGRKLSTEKWPKVIYSLWGVWVYLCSLYTYRKIHHIYLKLRLCGKLQYFSAQVSLNLESDWNLPVSVCSRLWKMEMFFVWGVRFLCRLGVHSYCSSLAFRSCWEEGPRRHLGKVYKLFKECCCSSKAELSSVTNRFRITHRAAKSQWWVYYSQCSTVTLIHFCQEKLIPL